MVVKSHVVIVVTYLLTYLLTNMLSVLGCQVVIRCGITPRLFFFLIFCQCAVAISIVRNCVIFLKLVLELVIFFYFSYFLVLSFITIWIHVVWYKLIDRFN